SDETRISGFSAGICCRGWVGVRACGRRRAYAGLGDDPIRRKLLPLLFAGVYLAGVSAFFASVRAETPGVTAQEILIGAFGPLSGGNSWIRLCRRRGRCTAGEEH